MPKSKPKAPTATPTPTATAPPTRPALARPRPALGYSPVTEADALIIQATEAYRAASSKGNGMGYLGFYAAEEAWEAMTGDQKKAVARKLKQLGWTEYCESVFGGGRPPVQFARFIARCCYGSEVSFPEVKFKAARKVKPKVKKEGAA